MASNSRPELLSQSATGDSSSVIIRGKWKRRENTTFTLGLLADAYPKTLTMSTFVRRKKNNIHCRYSKGHFWLEMGCG